MARVVKMSWSILATETRGKPIDQYNNTIQYNTIREVQINKFQSNNEGWLVNYNW